MRQRKLGNLEVSAIGFGCMPMSWGYSVEEADEAESRATLHRAVELGISLLDTADVYGPYTNEELLGACISADGLRDQVKFATKVGLTHKSLTEYGRDGSPAHIQEACEASLRRLQTDRIDLYQLHRIDPNVPLEETWGAMAALVEQGKVKNIGLSEVTVEEIERASTIHPVASVQSELSIWTSENVDNGVLAYCNTNGIALLAYSPLGRGFLTGTLSAENIKEGDFRSANPRFTPEAIAANQAIVDGIAEVAARHNASSAQVALAWVQAQGPVVIPIPGTKRRKWLEQNAAADEVRLTDQDFADIAALPKSVAPRY
jgi:aryl-alcohol dehydrogenase-like predicted oxidoreductase